VKDIVRWLEVNYSPTKVVYKESDKAVYIEHLEYDAIKAKYDNAKISTTSIGKLSNAAYDKLMSSSIIFLDLFDSAAVNTVIECIVRNTPLIVNRTAGVVDALGANYPLYYDNGLQADIDAQIEGLLTPEKILEAHLYLKNISNAVYKLDYFISDLRTKISAISL
jgi:hypothetical protein